MLQNLFVQGSTAASRLQELLPIRIKEFNPHKLGITEADGSILTNFSLTDGNVGL